MKLKNKTTLLAAAIALAGVTYLPSASANTFSLGSQPMSPETSRGFDSGSLVKGSFTDDYNFTVSAPFDILASLSSLRVTASTTGTKLTSFALFDGTTNLALDIISGTKIGKQTSYNSQLFAESLSANHWYYLEVKGNALSNGSTYSGHVNLSPSAVPLPGAVWMMMTGIIGLFGYQARNKKTA